jgi:hypothetical protein
MTFQRSERAPCRSTSSWAWTLQPLQATTSTTKLAGPRALPRVFGGEKSKSKKGKKEIEKRKKIQKRTKVL